MMRHIHILALLLAAAPLQAQSILDISHSISDTNIVPPESFETRTRELEENFYIRNYVASAPTAEARLGTPAEYEAQLAALPTIIEMPYNSIVGNYIDMYLGRRAGLVANMLALHSYYGNIFVEELEREGLPLELQYLPVIESAINPNAVSRAGATGLWQFMSATAKGLGMEINSLVDERRDPRLSSRMAARYLKQLHAIYDDWSLAIAAYNCGPGNVNKAMKRAGGEGKMDFWEIYNYLPQETRGYVPAFIAANYVMTYHARHGIAPTVVKRHLTTDTVTVRHRVHFNQIADVLQIPLEEIRMLNPQYRADVIPGDFRPYTLTLPHQQTLSYLVSEAAILAHDADLYARRTRVEPGSGRDETPLDETGANNLAAAGRLTDNAEQNMELATVPTAEVRRVSHTVGRGESLKDIAKEYGVSATDIKRWNKLRRGKVKEGQILTIETRMPAAPEMAAATPARQPERVETPPAPAPEKKAEEPAKTKTETKKAPAKKAEEKPKTTTYRVKKGDTLERIARAHGITVAELRAANGIAKNNDRLDINQRLKIPAKKKSSGRKSKRRR